MKILRVVLLAAAVVVSGSSLAPAAGVSLSLKSLVTERVAVACVSETQCAGLVVPDLGQPRPVQQVCVGTDLADPRPAHVCEVHVGGVLIGSAPEKVQITLSLQITSDDGNPWGDSTRQALRSRPELTQPATEGAPSICSLIPPADARVTCAKVGARTWKVTATTSTKTGTYNMPLKIAFPSSTAFEPQCEYLRIIATAKASGKTAKVDKGRKRYCA